MIILDLIYGADSKHSADTMLTNGYTLYDWVMRMSCFPSFWGRNISGVGALTEREIIFLKNRKCKIACIFDELIEEIIASNDGNTDGLKAVNAAKTLGIPQNKGIVIFVNVPSQWNVNHNWMISFAETVIKNGYKVGFIGNTDSSDYFNFDRQASHYYGAVGTNPDFPTLYWSKRPKYDFEPNIWAPFAPSALLPNDMDLWQYGTVAFHGIKAHKCYAKNKLVTSAFWDLEAN